LKENYLFKSLPPYRMVQKFRPLACNALSIRITVPPFHYPLGLNFAKGLKIFHLLIIATESY